MSMEYYAFVPQGALPTQADWQRTIASLGFSILLDPSFDPAVARGFCRMSVEGRNTGCEVDTNLDSVEELTDIYPALGGKLPDAAAVISFRFGGDMLAGGCAFAMAAALVKHHRAVFYDPQEDTFIENAETLVLTAGDFLAQ